jgi:hypothetical protein
MGLRWEENVKVNNIEIYCICIERWHNETHSKLLKGGGNRGKTRESNKGG